MSIAVFYSLSTVCQYLTMYRLLVLRLYVHCCLLHSVHCLSVPHNVPSVGSVSLCPPLSSTVCPLSVSTSQCTVWLVLRHYVHCCLLQTAHCLSVSHTVQSVHCLSVPRTPFAHRHHTTDYPAALTPSAASHHSFDKRDFNFCKVRATEICVFRWL
jgi:hypothetical protein